MFAFRVNVSDSFIARAFESYFCAIAANRQNNILAVFALRDFANSVRRNADFIFQIVISNNIVTVALIPDENIGAFTAR